MLGKMTNMDHNGLASGAAPFGGSHQLCSRLNISGINGHIMPVQYSGCADVWTLMLTGKPPNTTGNVADQASSVRAKDCTCPPPIMSDGTVIESTLPIPNWWTTARPTSSMGVNGRTKEGAQSDTVCDPINNVHQCVLSGLGGSEDRAQFV